MVVERTMARPAGGPQLEAARKQGRAGGRPKALSPAAAEVPTSMYHDRQSITHIATTLRVSRATIYRHIETLESSHAG